MNVLGLKIGGHDTGAALISHGKIVAIAEERITREKHSSAFPSHSIDYCLDALSIKPSEIDLIVLDRTSKESGLTGADVFRRETGTRFDGIRIEMIGHHDSHAAAAFFCSPYDEAAILVYDGNGDVYRDHHGAWVGETETLYRGQGTEITEIHKSTHLKSEKQFPFTSGIGILYQKISRDYIAFGSNNEGKMMGLAAYGNDALLKQFPLDRWLRDTEGYPICNGDIRFAKSSYDTKRLNWRTLLPTMYFGLRIRLKRTARTFARGIAARIASEMSAKPTFFEPIRMPHAARNPKTDGLPDESYSAAAYAAQKIFEEFAFRLGKKLKDVTGSENLCVSGGCALNIDANRNFITRVGFKNLFVQPASSDCGIPLGCALWGYHMILKQPRFWEMKSASLGKVYSGNDIDAAVAKFEGRISCRVSADAAKETAQFLSESQIVGWFQGGSEYGPRALGNRSILAHAGNKDMRDILNKRVKHREMWRPFAASILLERLPEWFDLDTKSPATAFMLLCADVHENKRKIVPSIVHRDGTCRMQSLTKEANGAYHRMVSEFDVLTGVPLVLNTSFNLGGDPIVETPFDAIDTFLRTDMDYLIIEDRVIQKISK